MRTDNLGESTYSFALSKELIMDELQEDISEKDKMFLENIGLVYSRIAQQFNNLPFEREDLLSIGMIGLTKAVEGYDSTRNIAFSTFAIKCIDNEIINSLRTYKKSVQATSLDKETEFSESANLLGIIEDKKAIISDIFEKQEELDILNYCIKSLPERHQKALILYFGFIGNRRYNHREIAEQLNVSTSAVQALLTRTLDVLRINIQSLEKSGKLLRKIRENHFFDKKG